MASLSPFDSSISPFKIVLLRLLLCRPFRWRFCFGIATVWALARITGLNCDLPELGTQEGAEIRLDFHISQISCLRPLLQCYPVDWRGRPQYKCHR